MRRCYSEPLAIFEKDENVEDQFQERQMIDYDAINRHAKKYEKTDGQIPSRSTCNSQRERRRAGGYSKNQERAGGYESLTIRIKIDKMGNLHARIGKGKKLIAIDAHVDTVGVGKRDEWQHDPYKGKLTKTHVFGRGAGDQEGAIPSMVYAGKIIKDLGIEVEGVVAASDVYNDGRGLRRIGLAVYSQRGEGSPRLRSGDRFHQLQYSARTPGADGNRCLDQGAKLSRQHAGKRR